MIKNFFKEMLDDEHYNALNNTIRWNGATRLKDESVAHHSFLVTWFARLIVEEVVHDVSEQFHIVTAAMFHDFDEMFSGDITYPVKYNKHNGKEFKKVIDDFNAVSVLDKFKDESITNSLYKRYLIDSNLSEVHKAFVKLADWLACLFYVHKEVGIGNSTMIDKEVISIEQIKFSASKLVKMLDSNYDNSLLMKIACWDE